MTGESLNIQQDQLDKLKQLFPEIFTESKVDWEKLQATLGKENVEFQNERYVLNWAGKTDAFKVLQQSTTATLKPVTEESINFDTTENVFIEGENLEVLKVLQKSYYGKIKCIEIDPPYNTGSDSFIYPDSFKESKEEYQKRIGEKDEEGYLLKEGMFRKNSKDSGHYHSNWLSMMYPRLFLAKNLLRDDGVIFVHIDDNEVHNLRLIMNEIFGEENFIAEIVWKCRAGGGSDSKYFAKDHEYILCFAKNSDNLERFGIDFNEEEIKKFNLEDKRGKYYLKTLERPEQLGSRPNLQYTIEAPDKTLIEKKRQDYNYTWVVSGKKFNELLKDDRIEFKYFNEKWMVYRKLYLNDIENGVTRYKKPRTILEGIALTRDGGKEIEDLLGKREIMSFPKPTALIKYIIQTTENEDDENNIILDFFGGSGTTAQAVLELNKEDGGNRKFILVQLPELCDENNEAFKAGFKTIADISKVRIKRVINKINKEKKDNKTLFTETEENKNLDLGFKVFKLSSSNFKIWRGNDITEDNIEAQLDAFTDPIKEGSEKENMLFELILKAGYLLTDKIEYIANYYTINDGELIIALDLMNQNLIETIISIKPKKVITLDILFAGNDQLKTNTVLQMKDAEIDFKTI